MPSKTFFVILSLSFLCIILSFQFFNLNNILVVGKAIKLAPNQNIMYKQQHKEIPIKGALVLASKGKVKAYQNNIFIPISKIKSPKIYSNSDQNGIFRFRLSPGEYTFFLIIDENAYLNSFDGKGYFSSKKIDSRNNNLVLTDDRDSLY